jgi:acyl-CoA thioesterase FadM
MVRLDDAGTPGPAGVPVGEVTRRVPPRHCDAQGIMHASRPAEYVEDAFLAWLDVACGGYGALRAAGVDLVVAEVTTRYLAAVRLGDEVTARATPVGRGRRSVTVRCDLVRGDEVLVTATTAYVCVGATGAAPLPAVLGDALAGVPGPPS